MPERAVWSEGKKFLPSPPLYARARGGVEPEKGKKNTKKNLAGSWSLTAKAGATAPAFEQKERSKKGGANPPGSTTPPGPTPRTRQKQTQPPTTPQPPPPPKRRRRTRTDRNPQPRRINQADQDTKPPPKDEPPPTRGPPPRQTDPTRRNEQHEDHPLPPKSTDERERPARPEKTPKARERNGGVARVADFFFARPGRRRLGGTSQVRAKKKAPCAACYNE